MLVLEVVVEVSLSNYKARQKKKTKVIFGQNALSTMLPKKNVSISARKNKQKRCCNQICTKTPISFNRPNKV